MILSIQRENVGVVNLEMIQGRDKMIVSYKK